MCWLTHILHECVFAASSGARIGIIQNNNTYDILHVFPTVFRRCRNTLCMDPRDTTNGRESTIIRCSARRFIHPECSRTTHDRHRVKRWRFVQQNHSRDTFWFTIKITKCRLELTRQSMPIRSPFSITQHPAILLAFLKHYRRSYGRRIYCILWTTSVRMILSKLKRSKEKKGLGKIYI